MGSFKCGKSFPIITVSKCVNRALKEHLNWVIRNLNSYLMFNRTSDAMKSTFLNMRTIYRNIAFGVCAFPTKHFDQHGLCLMDF